VLEKARRLAGGKLLVAIGLVRTERRRHQKGNTFGKHRHVAGRGDVVTGDERQPEHVVRAPGPHTAARRGVPPVEHVALRKLEACGFEQMSAHQIGSDVDECHHVL
jgi:hypothetical protein